MRSRRRKRRCFRPRLERLEQRLLLTYGPTIYPDGSVELTLDDAFDQFGFQPAIFQAYDSTPENGFDDALGAFSVFDTGASVVTFGANDQLVFSLLNETGGSAGIPIQVECGAVAEGVGGLSLVGHISEPGMVLADGLHVSSLRFDEDGFPIFELDFQDPPSGTVIAPLLGEDALLGDVSLSDQDDAYQGSFLAFTSGTLRGQIGQISGYSGVTRRFEFAASFAGSPAVGDTFVIVEATPPFVAETATGSVADSLPTSQQFSGSAELLEQDGYYEGQYVQFTSGVLNGQIRQIAEYQGATRTLLLNAPFPANPATGDTFRILQISATPAAIVSGIQAFLGAYEGTPPEGCPAPASPSLPTITGTPMLKPTADRPQGLAANVRPSGALMDFSDFAGFEGLVIPIPDVHFQAPGLGVPEDPVCLVADGGTTRSICTESVRMPLDFVGAEVDEPGQLSEGFNPVQRHTTIRHDGVELTDQVFLFDTGAQLSVISEAQAAAFGLDLTAPEDTISVQGAGGVINDLPGYRIDSLTVPLEDGATLTFNNVWVYVIDAAPGLLDGIMGMNLFNSAAALLYDPYHPDGPVLELTFFTEPPYSLPFSNVEEIEPNDTRDGAIALNRGQYGVGSLDATDVDFWGTPGGDQGDLVFAYVDTQSSGTGQNAALEIYANNDVLIGQDENDGPGGGAVVAGVELAAGQTGNVYYRVTAADATPIGRYELYSAVVDPLEVTQESELGSGGNDTPGTATPVTTTVMSGLLTTGDVDHYSFVATEDSRIVVMMDNDPDRDDALTATRLSLLAPDGTEILPPTVGDGDGNANAAGAVAPAPASGAYTLRVAADPSGTDEEYRFAILVLDGGSDLLAAQLVHSAEGKQAEADAALVEAEQAVAEAEQAIDDCNTDPDPFCLVDALIAYQEAVLAATEAALEAALVTSQVQQVQGFAGTIQTGGLPGLEIDKEGELQVSIADATISENGGRTTATVTRSTAVGEVIIRLQSSHVDEAILPATIVIPDGQTTSAPLEIVAVDDSILDGDQVLTISATASGYAAGQAALEVTDSEATGPAWQNAVNRFDVSGTQGVTALDVLLVINYLNAHPGSADLPPVTQSPPPYYDVDGNGNCTPADLLAVIDRINGLSGAGEGEAATLPSRIAEADPVIQQHLASPGSAILESTHVGTVAGEVLGRQEQVQNRQPHDDGKPRPRWSSAAARDREVCEEDAFWQTVADSTLLEDLVADVTWG